MKKFSISVVAGLLTFSIGVVVTLLWMTRNTPELINEKKPSGWCVPLATQKIDSLKMGEDGYFPEAAFYPKENPHQMMRSWYAKYLAQMNEPPLLDSHTSNSDETYRFTWLRSFHAKVVVRVWTDGGVRMLTVKELGRENAAPVRRGVTRPLNDDEWAEFNRLFDTACVWNLPTSEGPIAADGAWWMFEAKSAGFYHVLARQVPENSYRELCLYLLKLSGLPLDASKGEIY